MYHPSETNTDIVGCGKAYFCCHRATKAARWRHRAWRSQAHNVR